LYVSICSCYSIIHNKRCQGKSIVAMEVSNCKGKWMITSEHGCCVQYMGHRAVTGCNGKSMVAFEVTVCYKMWMVAMAISDYFSYLIVAK
jgi:hypothetical protein